VEQTLRVTLYGVTGYTGIELLRVLINHPYVKITNLISKSSAGKRLGQELPLFENSCLANFKLTSEPEEDFDIAFLCLPHEISLNLVPQLLDKGKKVIDLSGAYRIKDPSVYPYFYGFNHGFPNLLEKAVYGLPELFRRKIKNTSLVANPGCYPTASLLAIYPLLKEHLDTESIIIHALSGVSGAGRKTSRHFHFPEIAENLFPYAVEAHRHVPEIESILENILSKRIKIRFTPTVIPVSRGMLVTVYVKLREIDLMELFFQTYKEEPFVRVIQTPPQTRWVLGTNYCFIYPYYDRRTSTAVIFSAIDNLGKGASLQAVQNMNLIIGLDEREGLPISGIFP